MERPPINGQSAGGNDPLSRQGDIQLRPWMCQGLRETAEDIYEDNNNNETGREERSLTRSFREGGRGCGSWFYFQCTGQSCH